MKQDDGSQMNMKMGWGMFAVIVAVMAAIMFFLMYQSSYSADHLTFSQTRLWMAVVMASVMSVVMLGFMWSMFRGKRTKIAVVAGAALVFVASLWLVRGQETVGDVSFMKAMIPHHSMAILNSRRAQISDPRVRKLADEIIASQVREIAEMQILIEDIERNGERGDRTLAARPAVVTPDMRPKIEEAVR